MAPLQDFISSRKVLFFLLFIFASLLVLSTAHTTSTGTSPFQENSITISIELLGRRALLEKLVQDSDSDDDEKVQIQQPVKKKSSITPAVGTTKNTNKTKLIKPATGGASANSTKLIKTDSAKNQTKPLKLTSSNNSTKTNKDSTFQEKPTPKLSLKKLNSTSKPSNSTKPISKSTNSTKPISKTTNLTKPNSLLSQKSTDPAKKTEPAPEKKTPKKQTTWGYQDDGDDLVAEFRDLPSRFQESLLPDLEVISTTSKAYLNKANKEITKGFKPYVGKKYASTVAAAVSVAFIIIPLLLVSLIFNRIKAYFSLQKLLIFIQIYLSIYFSILCLSSLVTGLEPLKFFYATSQSTYICIQLLQTLAYVLYLLVLLMYLVLVFSTETGMVSKLLSLGQTFVGFAVGLHYYMTVFHRAVLRQPPKTSWKVHAFYSTCFLLICLLSRFERRKKAYLADGVELGKTS